MINARIAQIDHLISLQLNEVLHHPAFQKLEGTWRGLKYLLDQSETSEMLKIKVLNVVEEGPAEGPAARAGVRSERAVQKSLRRGVRRLRRRSVRRPGRRLRIRQGAGGHRAAGEDLAGGRGGACAVPRRRASADLLEPGQLYAAGRAARSRQDLRHHRVREVEVLPRSRRTRATWRWRCRMS